MNNIIGPKSLKIKSYLPIGMLKQYLKDGAFIEVNNALSNTLNIIITLKQPLPDAISKEYGNRSFINIHYTKRLPDNSLMSKAYPLKINTDEFLEYRIKPINNNSWPLMLQSTVKEIETCDYLIFETPSIGLEFNLVVFIEDKCNSLVH